MSDRFAGRRNYFRRGDWVARWKWGLSAVALLGAVAYAGVEVARPSLVHAAHTHGTLAGVHAPWDNNCEACHVAASPSGASLLSLADPGSRWNSYTCEKCHAGPAHFANASPADAAHAADCAACHHDHNGRANSLVRIGDSHCGTCHENLTPHRPSSSAGKRPVAASIKDFAGHPEFAPLTAPPERTLKFSHALHTAPGVAYSAGGKEALTAANISARLGERAARQYAGIANAEGLVQLACASCHQLDARAGSAAHAELGGDIAARSEPNKAVLPPRASGEYFLGVNFEAHCRACHPVNASPKEALGKEVAAFDLPHRVNRPQLEAAVKSGYLSQLLLGGERPDLDTPVGPALGQIGVNLAPPPAETLRGAVGRYAGEEAARQFAPGGQGCAKCHDLGESGVKAVPDRTVWLPASRFNHAAHKSAACAECHPGTYAAVSEPLAEKEPPQINGVESCRACHAPSGTPVSLPSGTIPGGGVRHSCTDCHRYHNGDHSLEGKGALARFPAKPLDIGEFLKGGAP